jgi:tRNA pseudouridine38-40 synthase
MHNVKLTIAYDGTAFLGWQKTRMGRSVEEVLQQVLEQILQEKICLQAASRTDAGVHARGQIVNFLTSKENLRLEKLLVSLNSLLPEDVAVMAVEEVPLQFHPTLHCQSKEYHYWVCYGQAQLPQQRFYSWHYPHRLDLAAMREAALLFIGERDFSAFCNFKKNSRYHSFSRQIWQLDILDFPDKQLCFKIRGNHFLYKMARNIVGTLVYVGITKIALEEIPIIFSTQDRTKAGITAPAHGLCLYRVYY